jgi:hypothetical protein
MRIYSIERKQRKRGKERKRTKLYAPNSEDYGLNKEVPEELPIQGQSLKVSNYIFQ